MTRLRIAVLVVAASLCLVSACNTPPPGGPTPFSFRVTTVMPMFGPTQTQTQVQIFGAGFEQGMAVLFGSEPAEIVTLSSSLIVVRTPIRAAGDVNIIVRALNGERAIFSKPFSFVDSTVTKVTPNPGLPGMFATVTGSYFAPGTRVTFGGKPADIIDLGTHDMLIRLPRHDPGPVEVAVIPPSGPTLTLPGGFTFTSVTVLPSTSSVAAASPMKVSWVVPFEFWYNDFFSDTLALYRVGAPDGVPIWLEDIWSEKGSFDLTAPVQPGEYEFRFLMNNRSTVVGTAPLVVVAPPASARQ